MSLKRLPTVLAVMVLCVLPAAAAQASNVAIQAQRDSGGGVWGSISVYNDLQSVGYGAPYKLKMTIKNSANQVVWVGDEPYCYTWISCTRNYVFTADCSLQDPTSCNQGEEIFKYYLDVYQTYSDINDPVDVAEEIYREVSVGPPPAAEPDAGHCSAPLNSRTQLTPVSNAFSQEPRLSAASIFGSVLSRPLASFAHCGFPHGHGKGLDDFPDRPHFPDPRRGADFPGPTRES